VANSGSSRPSSAISLQSPRHCARRALSLQGGYVTLTYVSRNEQIPESQSVRQRLIEAEQEYQRARTDDYVTRLVRDSAIVDAHRMGLSSREISSLVGDIGQPNVVRARRRAATRREVVPQGLLSPVDAIRESGLGPREFILAVREGRLTPVELPGGVRSFRVEDVRQMRSAS
jgi:hypothetical protein